MKCLICDATFSDNEVLKSHNVWHHSINENNYFFRELFSPNNISRRCDECKLEFKNFRLKKNHNLLLHYNQVGRRRNQQLPINVLRRGPIFYYSINFDQHKNFYDFYDEKIVDDFLNSVYERFVSGKNFHVQVYVEIVTYQWTQIVNRENNRVWLTDVFKDSHFNQYIRKEIKNNILKRVITNGETSSSWVFKGFNKFQIIATDKSDFKNVMSG